MSIVIDVPIAPPYGPEREQAIKITPVEYARLASGLSIERADGEILIDDGPFIVERNREEDTPEPEPASHP
jgi:hypothetical protein